MKAWLKDHFDLGVFTPKPVGYCKDDPYECNGCGLLNLVAWFIQSAIIMLTGVGILGFIVAVIAGGIRF